MENPVETWRRAVDQARQAFVGNLLGAVLVVLNDREEATFAPVGRFVEPGDVGVEKVLAGIEDGGDDEQPFCLVPKFQRQISHRGNDNADQGQHQTAGHPLVLHLGDKRFDQGVNHGISRGGVA